MEKTWIGVIITFIVALLGIGKLVRDEIKEAEENERKNRLDWFIKSTTRFQSAVATRMVAHRFKKKFNELSNLKKMANFKPNKNDMTPEQGDKVKGILGAIIDVIVVLTNKKK